MAWIAVIVIALFPQIIIILIEKTGGERTGIGTIFGISLVFLFFVIYRIYLKAQRIEQQLQKLVRDMAIKNIDK